jgi:hypothetical protein
LVGNGKGGKAEEERKRRQERMMVAYSRHRKCPLLLIDSSGSPMPEDQSGQRSKQGATGIIADALQAGGRIGWREFENVG